MRDTSIDRAAIATHLAMAAYHLAACWDELRSLEMLTGETVESDNEALQFVASDIDIPSAVPSLDDETVSYFLDSLEGSDA